MFLVQVEVQFKIDFDIKKGSVQGNCTGDRNSVVTNSLRRNTNKL